MKISRKDSGVEIKTPEQILKMRRAGMVVAQIHQALREACRPGVTTAELDEVSAAVIARNGAYPSFLGYEGYPATVCISINEEVVHGIPSDRVLQYGDLVSFDCGAYIVDEYHREWHGDAAFSMIVGGEAHARPDDLELLATTEQSLWHALAALARGTHLNVVGDAVEEIVALNAERFGWEAGIVEDYVGHGIGTQMHMPPDVLNYSVRGKGLKLKPGMVLAVEPMLCRGTGEIVELSDGWTVATADGQRAAHFEHTVALLPGGIWVLTAYDGGREGLAAYGISPRAIAPKG